MAQDEATRPAIYLPQAPQGKDSLNFKELSHQVNATIGHFQASGIKTHMRVLLMVRPGLDLIVTVFALFKMGAVPIVIDPGMGLRKFLYNVRKTQPEGLVGIAKAQWIARLFPKAFTSVQYRATVGHRTPKDPQHFECIQSKSSDLGAILFTSGSTGPAKGVCYEHGMFNAQLRSIQKHYNIERGEIDCPLLPVFALFNPALGMATVVPEINPARPATLNPARIVNAIQRYQVTNSFGSPALWRRIGQYCQAKNITLPSIRRILMAGAPVPPSLVKMFNPILTDGTIHTPYGATESLPLCSIDGESILANADKQTAGKGTCVGTPMSQAQVEVIGAQASPIEVYTPDMNCKVGEVGEIIARGEMVTRCYDENQQATDGAKILWQKETPDSSQTPTLWHRLGDMGYFDSEGKLWFCGRQAELVRAKNGTLYTDCTEAIFNQHPRVYRSALIGLGSEPAIVIEPESGHFPRSKHARKIFIEELLQYASSQSHTNTIERFFFCKKFPVDIRHNAKIHRLTLQKRFDK